MLTTQPEALEAEHQDSDDRNGEEGAVGECAVWQSVLNLVSYPHTPYLFYSLYLFSSLPQPTVTPCKTKCSEYLDEMGADGSGFMT